MTYNEFDSLKKYLQYNTDAKTVIIGNKILSDNQYPAIRILIDETGKIDEVKQNHFMPFTLAMKIQIVDIDDEERLIKTLKIMDDFLTYIRNFHPEKGHYLSDGPLPEYTENLYIIRFIYNMKFRLQNTGG